MLYGGVWGAKILPCSNGSILLDDFPIIVTFLPSLIMLTHPSGQLHIIDTCHSHSYIDRPAHCAGRCPPSVFHCNLAPYHYSSHFSSYFLSHRFHLVPFVLYLRLARTSFVIKVNILLFHSNDRNII